MINRIIDFLTFYIKGGVVYARRIGVHVGNNCRIYTKNFGSEPFLVSFGNDVTVAEGASFITHDGSFGLFKDHHGRRYKYQKINVGNNVFIGVNSIIMPGVKIDDQVIVAAGSVVTKSVPAGTIVAGVPAKIVGSFDELKERSLEQCIKDDEIDFNLSYKTRVLKVVDNTYKPYLQD